MSNVTNKKVNQPHDFIPQKKPNVITMVANDMDLQVVSESKKATDGDGTNRNVLYGVRQFGDGKSSEDGLFGWEFSEYAAAVRSAIQYIEKDDMFDFTFFANACGATFSTDFHTRMIYPGNYADLESFSILAPMTVGLLGYDYEIVEQIEGRDNESFFKQKIKSSIDLGHPVIMKIASQTWVRLSHGSWRLPCAITGYDNDGDIIIGWHSTQEKIKYDMHGEIEDNGYFRQSNWFGEGTTLLVINDKISNPNLSDVYRQILINGITVSQGNYNFKNHISGLNAYDAWANAVLDDDNFTNDDLGLLIERAYDCFHEVDGGYYLRRHYLIQFLQRIIDNNNNASNELIKAIAVFKNENDIEDEIQSDYFAPLRYRRIGYVGDKKILEITSRKNRERFAKYILHQKEKDAKIFKHIENAIALL